MERKHTMLIHAAPNAVWSVTVDVPAWPEWTPTVRAARALTSAGFGVGSHYALKQPFQPETVWEVTACHDGESFTWESRETPQLLRATHRLEAHNEGTLNTLILEAPGMKGAVRRAFLGRLFAMALAKENAGLKAFCERASDR